MWGTTPSIVMPFIPRGKCKAIEVRRFWMTETSRKRKSYDTSYKLKPIEQVEQSLKEAAAQEFGVDAKRIHVWCSQKDWLAAMKKEKMSMRKRLDGAGRKLDNAEIEEELFGWIVELRSRHLCVSWRMIQMQAKSLSSDNGFKASCGWIDRFMKRHFLSLRRKPPSRSLFLVMLFRSWCPLCCICEQCRSATSIDQQHFCHRRDCMFDGHAIQHYSCQHGFSLHSSEKYRSRKRPHHRRTYS